VPRVLLLLPTTTYRATDFVRAAGRLGAEVVVGSEERQALADDMGDRAVVVPLSDIPASIDAIAALHERSPIDAVVAVDDQGVEVAAVAGERLGLRHTDPAAAAATRDKAVMRDALARAGVPQPRFALVQDTSGLEDVASTIPFPWVVKPLNLSASRGVIRADDLPSARDAAERVHSISVGPLLVEEYVPGVEVAVEGIVRREGFEVLAVFDKPDALVGPYFEETIYVTPSRLPQPVLDAVAAITERAAAAISLSSGPVHAELRIAGSDDLRVIEIAARSIGGLCARTLRFGAGIALEELILRDALDLPIADMTRETAASGVMMLPIERSGVLEEVRGQDAARAVPGITGLEITVPRGRAVVALPEGDRYLGFLFARADTPEEVEAALRTGYAALDVVLSS
jgi:biotin carboxylase